MRRRCAGGRVFLTATSFAVVAAFFTGRAVAGPASGPTTQAATQPSTAPAATSEVLENRLRRAEAAFSAIVESASKRLGDEFEAVAGAYERAGNEARARATREARDARFAAGAATRPALPADGGGRAVASDRPEVKDGWSVLFRSSDPLLWDVAVRNTDSFAVPVASAPPGFRYVRLTRADTGEYVIVPAATLRSGGEPGSRPWFRGDKRIDKQGCCLGIVDGARPVDVEHVPILRSSTAGSFSGWGFGIWLSGPERQAWVWDGKPLKETIMEIAVTGRELTAEEKTKLLGR